MDKRKAKKRHINKARLERPKLALLALMALLILSPALASACGLSEATPELAINENRNRLAQPAIDAAEAFSGTGEYFTKWDSYYNDSFGTRDLFIRVKNQLNYSLFRYNPELFFDDKGNMYYYSVVAVNQIANERIEDFTPILDKHAELVALCQARGITYVFIYPPQKNTVYRPEGHPVKRPDPVALERFYAACENDPRLKGRSVNVIETLRAQTLPVYGKVDFHWNDYGSALGFGDVVNRLAALEGLEPLFKNDLVISDLHTSGLKGGQLDNLSIFTPHYEISTNAHKATPITSGTPDWSIPNVTFWTNQADAPLGTALFIGSSFTPPALYDFNGSDPGIRDFFEKVYYINHAELEPGFMSSIPDKIDYLIFELIEAVLGSTEHIDAIIAELSSE